jgi:hypothetical protein
MNCSTVAERIGRTADEGSEPGSRRRRASEIAMCVVVSDARGFMPSVAVVWLFR